MSYFYLFLAVLLEVIAVVLMKESQGMSVVIFAIGGFVAYGLSFTFAAFAGKKLDVSFVYATWSSLAIIAVFLVGFLFYGDVINLLKILSAIMITAGVIGFNLAGTKH